jgi:quinol monooxygenase YgiN
MITVILSHEVKDYSTWRKVYDEDEINRSKAGINLTGVFESIDNPNMITMVGEAPSVEAIKNFMANPNLKAAMEQGGVISKPEVKLIRKV